MASEPQQMSFDYEQCCSCPLCTPVENFATFTHWWIERSGPQSRPQKWRDACPRAHRYEFLSEEEPAIAILVLYLYISMNYSRRLEQHDADIGPGMLRFVRLIHTTISETYTVTTEQLERVRKVFMKIPDAGLDLADLGINLYWAAQDIKRESNEDE